MIRINLLPRRRRGVINLPRVGLVAAIGLILAAFAGATVLMLIRNDGVRSEIAALDNEITALRPRVEEVQRLLREIETLREKEEIITELEARRLHWASILVDVSAQTPRDVWLVTIFTEGQGAVSIGGNGLSFKAIAEFMRNLERSAMFERVDLTRASRADIAGRRVINFGLTMKLSLPQVADQTKKDGTSP